MMLQQQHEQQQLIDQYGEEQIQEVLNNFQPLDEETVMNMDEEERLNYMQ